MQAIRLHQKNLDVIVSQIERPLLRSDVQQMIDKLEETGPKYFIPRWDEGNSSYHSWVTMPKSTMEEQWVFDKRKAMSEYVEISRKRHGV